MKRFKDFIVEETITKHIPEVTENGDLRNFPDDAKEKFHALGELQRDKPEHQMLRVQFKNGGGVLNRAVEHIGDITHRMVNHVKYNKTTQENVHDKVNKTHDWLNHEYGFEREHNQNVNNNAKYREVSPEELHSQVNHELQKYADEHSKLPVYNKLHYHAREAAVSLGRKKFKDSSKHLEALKHYTSMEPKEYSKHAFSHYRDSSGNIVEYKPGME